MKRKVFFQFSKASLYIVNRHKKIVYKQPLQNSEEDNIIDNFKEYVQIEPVKIVSSNYARSQLATKIIKHAQLLPHITEKNTWNIFAR